MKAAIHYIVKAKLIRFVKDGKINFIELNEKFTNSNPILAREVAFKYYQNYIDVLLQGKGKKYYNDREARKNLTTFINPGTTTKLKVGEIEFEISDSFGNGIGVYLVIDNPMQDHIMEDKVGDEYLIHGIGNIGTDGPQAIMDSLNHEFWYYEHYGYDTSNYKITVNFYEYEIEEAELNEILDTPFNWTGYDMPYYGESVYDEHRPVFIKGQIGKEFYVRLMGSCEPYLDIEDITSYCIEKWKQ